LGQISRIAEMWFLTMQLRQIGVLFLLILDSATVFAEPGGNRLDARNAVRAYHIQNAAMDRGSWQEPQQVQPPADRRRPKEADLPQSSGYGAPAEGQANTAADNNRKQGRLTPEERRALRRQIDEVGHDIYTPKR
jgi:hypothetical protein